MSENKSWLYTYIGVGTYNNDIVPCRFPYIGKAGKNRGKYTHDIMT